MKRIKEIIFVQEIITDFHKAENRIKKIPKETRILQKKLLTEVNVRNKKLIHRELSSLDREFRGASLFCRQVNEILENIEQDTAVDKITYGIFRYYFFKKSHQELAANEFNLTRTPGRERIMLCTEIFIYYWTVISGIQPLEKSSTSDPMTVTK